MQHITIHPIRSPRQRAHAGRGRHTISYITLIAIIGGLWYSTNASLTIDRTIRDSTAYLQQMVFTNTGLTDTAGGTSKEMIRITPYKNDANEASDTITDTAYIRTPDDGKLNIDECIFINTSGNGSATGEPTIQIRCTTEYTADIDDTTPYLTIDDESGNATIRGNVGDLNISTNAGQIIDLNGCAKIGKDGNGDVTFDCPVKIDNTLEVTGELTADVSCDLDNQYLQNLGSSPAGCAYAKYAP